MTDDEKTVLAAIMFLEEHGKESFLGDIRNNCLRPLTDNELTAALETLRAARAISITPRGWVTTA